MVVRGCEPEPPWGELPEFPAEFPAEFPDDPVAPAGPPPADPPPAEPPPDPPVCAMTNGPPPT
ncbi:MAG: hypothetical protein ACRDZ3_18490, partial [Acidimicrobiia bacterium]